MYRIIKKQSKKFMSAVSFSPLRVSWVPTARETHLSEEIFWTNLFIEKILKNFLRAHGRERAASDKLGLVGPNFERRELVK